MLRSSIYERSGPQCYKSNTYAMSCIMSTIASSVADGQSAFVVGMSVSGEAQVVVRLNRLLPPVCVGPYSLCRTVRRRHPRHEPPREALL